jgi:hypothetical protein
LLLQTVDFDAAPAAVSEACCMSPGNRFHADLVVALHMLRDDRDALARIGEGRGGRAYAAEHARAGLARARR